MNCRECSKRASCATFREAVSNVIADALAVWSAGDQGQGTALRTMLYWMCLGSAVFGVPVDTNPDVKNAVVVATSMIEEALDAYCDEILQKSPVTCN